MEENYGHKSVLLHECLDALAIKPDGIYGMVHTTRLAMARTTLPTSYWAIKLTTEKSQ